MNVAQVRELDISNGPGARVSLFVSGCKFNCDGCFNPETHSYDYGTEYTTETHNQIAELCERPYIAGLSILGGDPLWQDYQGLVQLRTLCQEVRCVFKTIWLWTGFTWEEVFNPPSEDGKISLVQIARQDLISHCDVIVDGRFETDKKDISLAFRGSSNQRIIDVQKSLEQNQVVLYEFEKEETKV